MQSRFLSDLGVALAAPTFSIDSFAIREYRMGMLKGQDIVILMNLTEHSEGRLSYAALGEELCMSPSEVHAGVSRLALAGLVDAETRRVKTAAALEFLKHGLKYIFPLERKGGLCRGVPTAHAAPCTQGVFTVDGEPPACLAGRCWQRPGPWRDPPSPWRARRRAKR